MLARAFVLLALFAPLAARADVAPGLSVESLRQEGRDALARIAGARSLTPGLYAAFDPDPVHPYALPACDDDGDPVVVVSDAALKLAENASYGLALDDAHGTRLLGRYADSLRTTQKPETRLLPPDPEFFRGVDPVVERAALAHFRSALLFLVGLSVSVHDAGEFRCLGADDLREHGDATWTAAERTLALARAATLAPERQPLRTRWSLAGSFAAGADERGATALATLVHPWRGPFPWPSADQVRAGALAVRASRSP